MNRLYRKNRIDIEYKGCGDLTDAFDDVIKSAWYINDDELDYICEHSTDEELDLFMGGDGSFGDKRKALKVVEDLLTEMYTNVGVNR